MKKNKNGHKCPHCNKKLTRWELTMNPFSEWETDHLYICFSNDCPYFKRSWDTMEKQGVLGFSYRLMYDPERDVHQAILIPTINESKGNVEEQKQSVIETCKGLGRQYG